MAAPQPSGNSTVDTPATAEQCARDYAQANTAASAGAYRDQLGSASSAQPHTNR